MKPRVLFAPLACLLSAVILYLAIATDAPAGTVKPVTLEAKRWHPPRWWYLQAVCIHRHESIRWFLAGVDWAGRPSPYFGGFQFLASTWWRAGGRGLPHEWAPREQYYRAWRIWSANRGSWREWGTAQVCGV